MKLLTSLLIATALSALTPNASKTHTVRTPDHKTYKVEFHYDRGVQADPQDAFVIVSEVREWSSLNGSDIVVLRSAKRLVKVSRELLRFGFTDGKPDKLSDRAKRELEAFVKATVK